VKEIDSSRERALKEMRGKICWKISPVVGAGAWGGNSVMGGAPSNRHLIGPGGGK